MLVALVGIGCGSDDGTTASSISASTSSVTATDPTTVDSTLDTTDAPDITEPPTDVVDEDVPLAEWIDEQEAAGRDQGYPIVGDGTD